MLSAQLAEAEVIPLSDIPAGQKRIFRLAQRIDGSDWSGCELRQTRVFA